MRRLRQVSPQIVSPGVARLMGAFVASLCFHAALLALPGARPGASPQPRTTVLHATLQAASPKLEPSSRRSFAVPSALSTPETLPGEPAEWPPDPGISVPVPEAAAVADAGIPALRDLVHYEAKELDTYPQLRAPLNPVYPQAALAQGTAGAVTVLVLIDETGKVTEASVIDAVPAGYYEDSARDALLQAAFWPASREGRNVRSRILVNMAFGSDSP
jgi:TonB family protein